MHTWHYDVASPENLQLTFFFQSGKVLQSHSFLHFASKSFLLRLLVLNYGENNRSDTPHSKNSASSCVRLVFEKRTFEPSETRVAEKQETISIFFK